MKAPWEWSQSIKFLLHYYCTQINLSQIFQIGLILIRTGKWAGRWHHGHTSLKLRHRLWFQTTTSRRPYHHIFMQCEEAWTRHPLLFITVVVTQWTKWIWGFHLRCLSVQLPSVEGCPQLSPPAAERRARGSCGSTATLQTLTAGPSWATECLHSEHKHRSWSQTLTERIICFLFKKKK